VLYMLLFDQPQQRSDISINGAGLGAIEERFSLPFSPDRSIANNRRVKTAEIVFPRSVTEHTTRLLNDNY
jgi:hypothetical protein